MSQVASMAEGLSICDWWWQTTSSPNSDSNSNNNDDDHDDYDHDNDDNDHNDCANNTIRLAVTMPIMTVTRPAKTMIITTLATMTMAVGT